MCNPLTFYRNYLLNSAIGDLMPSRLPRALLALVLVTACQEAPVTAPPLEYRPEEAGTVDHALCLLGFDAVSLKEVSTGHHLVQATINGRSGSFVVDTGANVTVVDRSHAQFFGLPNSGDVGALAAGMANGGRATQVSVESFRIGALDVRQQRVVTAELGQLLQALGRASGTTVYGLIGQDVLKEHRSIVDVARPMLYMMGADREPAPISAERCRDEAAPARK